jgi:ADP-dependent NAD(P)H-hydrate dehydratase / NAD(P)H-hydrate epimerase
MKIVTSVEMRGIDRVTSERFGVPSLTLMENAGSAVAEFALSAYPAAKVFGVICGKGNNGGDGFVVARKLRDAGKEVRVLILADPEELRGDAAENFAKLSGKSKSPPFRREREKGGTTLAMDTAKNLGPLAATRALEGEVLIDAILGSGFRPPVSGLYAEAIAKINSSRAPVIAVDIPSGADAEVMGGQTGAVARADAIVTFTAPRPAHVFGELTSGPIVVAPIGSPEEAIQSSLNLNGITPKDVAPLIGPRPRDSNKGMYGHVLVAGGSVGKAGAVAMAGFSALRAGAGLVTVATPKSVLPTVAGFYPELMTEPLDETGEGTISIHALELLQNLAEKKTVLAIGPGISRNDETAEVVRKIVAESDIPIVLDADGLNAFEGRAIGLNRRGRRDDADNAEKPTLVLTPHPGEMARLTGLSTKEIQRDRVNIARSFAKEHSVILLLKGDRTIVANSSGEAWVNTTGNPGMATGGTGDVLTGIVAGMLAQNPGREFEAVLAAVYLHGLAGDIAREQVGEQALVATDLLRTLPEAFQRVRTESVEKWVKIGSLSTKAV